MRGFEKVTGFDDAIIPKRATMYSAGYDFSAYEDVVINENEIVLVKTGIKAFMEEDEVLKIYPRSSLPIKKGLTLANNVGIIDSDYYNNTNNEGHIMIMLRNFTSKPVQILKGERIAQGIFLKYLTTYNDEVNSQRDGGFGSTK